MIPEDAPTLVVRVLGDVRVEVAGEPVCLSPQQRRLVAALVATPHRRATNAELIDRLWGDRPPKGARKLLHGLVLRVRRATAGAARQGAELLRTGDRGYEVAALVDADRFATVVDATRRSVDHERRALDLGSALRLWRGSPYGEFGDESWACVERARLDVLHTEAQERFLESVVECGRAQEALPSLEALTHSDPLHEPYWALLMLALRHLGREAQALETYERARARLWDELGVEPGTRLRRLEAATRRECTAATVPA